MKNKILFFISLIFIPIISYPITPEDIKIKTEDGWKLNAKWLKPVKENNVFLFIHSQKKNLMEWKNWFPEIERYGYGYLAIDLRGHGLSNIDPEGSTITYKSFNIDGMDNEYNKMIRDIDAAIIWLSTNSISENRIILVGSWLGANLAIKSAAINQNIPMTIAIYPSLNINSVLTVNPLRVYGKRPILFVTGYKYAKKYNEFQILNGIAKNSAGSNNAFCIVESDIKDASNLKINTIRKIIEWVQNPTLPEIVNYEVKISTINGVKPSEPQPEDEENNLNE